MAHCVLMFGIQGTNYTLNVVDLLTEGQPVKEEFNFSSTQQLATF